MHEAMRLFPPVPFDMKECVADTLLPNGINVKAGQIVMYIMYAMGRDKSRWGEDAAEFKPERFLAGRRRTAFEYPVFNAGPRTCLGQNMAILEAVMVLSSLFQRYTFEGDVSTKVQYGITVTLPVKGGLAVRAIPRR